MDNEPALSAKSGSLKCLDLLKQEGESSTPIMVSIIKQQADGKMVQPQSLTHCVAAILISNAVNSKLRTNLAIWMEQSTTPNFVNKLSELLYELQ